MDEEIFLSGVIEEGVELIELLLRDRIIFVRMAFGATDRQTQPDRAGGRRAVNSGFAAKLLRIDATFFVRERLAMESSRGLLRKSGVGQQVAGNLLNGKLIERHVAIDHLDYPIAIEVSVG